MKDLSVIDKKDFTKQMLFMKLFTKKLYVCNKECILWDDVIEAFKEEE